jgi:hypothetical protein
VKFYSVTENPVFKYCIQRTGNVATNKNIKFIMQETKSDLKQILKNNSQPRGEWNPTSKSVPKSNKKDLVVSLKL